MPWQPGVPPDPAVWRGGIVPIAHVIHRTYGFWPGDYAVIKSAGTAHWLTGQEPGQEVQFMDSSIITYHCNGANQLATGDEYTGTNEQRFTQWQVDRLGARLDWLRETHGIQKVYLDPFSRPPASVWVNGGGYRGSLSHYSVQTDDGSSQHTDLILLEDWERAVTTGIPPVPPGKKGNTMEFGTSPYNRNEVWVSDGTFKRHVMPTEWAFRVYVGAPPLIAFDFTWFNDLITAKDLPGWMQQQSSVVMAHDDLNTGKVLAKLP